MVQRRSKILDTDLQLYLTGELEGEKLVRVSEIDATPISELKLASDRRAKEVLGKLREVDQMFEPNIDDTHSDFIWSTELPEELKNQTDFFDYVY